MNLPESGMTFGEKISSGGYEARKAIALSFINRILDLVVILSSSWTQIRLVNVPTGVRNRLNIAPVE